MRLLPPTLRIRLSDAGLLPTSKLARAAWYVLSQAILFFLLKHFLSAIGVSWATYLSGWIGFLSFMAIVLFVILGLREARTRLLWRLRNRLIVTYMFIGVIPVLLLIALALGSFYLFAGQFATFIVTTSLNSQLKSVDAANSAIAHELAARLNPDSKPEPLGIESLRSSNQAWSRRHIHVWHDGKLLLSSTPEGSISTPPALPSFLKDSFNEIVRDRGELYLRAVETVTTPRGRLTVLSSEPLDAHLLQTLAANLGELTLYTTGLSRVAVEPKPSGVGTTVKPDTQAHANLSVSKPGTESYVFDTSKAPAPSFVVGSVPPANGMFDKQVSFATAISVVDWDTGDTSSPAAVAVQTRVSQLYNRLFGALGDFAPAIESSLFVVAVILAIIELIALWIGTRLTRTVTGAVAQLYEATKHINRGDFSHRIAVKSTDQIATLANSFNSMTTSLEELIKEQKEKQRLEGELAIAQEVQEQLYPREISQLASLEVHGFCRPARTVSGDYYDFLPLDSDRLILAVGDISGKGISAALLMATIHSAVRAYSEDRAPVMREAGDLGSSIALAPEYVGESSPGTLLALLNHQLYISTPIEKYATLFLATYNGRHRKLTYSNGGHLQPIVLHRDGSLTRLDRGGTVIGLFDDCVYDEGTVPLQAGDIFIAYSDGVSEPENDFGEFGEERLIDLVRENKSLPLVRITEIVTAAVMDWIGANEQPDDITLVLARAR